MLTVSSKLRYLITLQNYVVTIMDMYGYNAQKWDKI